MTEIDRTEGTATSRGANEPRDDSGGRVRATVRNLPTSHEQQVTGPLPQALEALGFIYSLNEQSRAALEKLPEAGIQHFADAIHFALDTGVPVKQLSFYLHADPEEGGQELVARVLVELEGEQALEEWASLTQRIYAAREILPEQQREVLDEDFAFEIRWPVSG